MTNNETMIVLKINGREDAFLLSRLLEDNNYRVTHTIASAEDAMGVDIELLQVIVPAVSVAIASFISVIKVWLKNRSVEIEVENKKTGHKVKIRSDKTISISDDMMEKIERLISDKPKKKKEG